MISPRNKKTALERAKEVEARAEESAQKARGKRIAEEKRLTKKAKIAETKIDAIYGRVIRAEIKKDDELKLLVETLINERVSHKKEREFLGLQGRENNSHDGAVGKRMKAFAQGDVTEVKT